MNSRALRLIAEARWLLFAAVALYLLVILFSHTNADPGWSRDTGRAVVNKGGRFGAWLSDVLFYVFGWSAFWWAVACAKQVWGGFARLRERMRTGESAPLATPHMLAVSAVGFTLLMIGSVGVEAMRFWDVSSQLPFAPGGVLGDALATHIQRWLGFTGGTVALLALFFAGFSLYFQVSWISLAEHVGAWLEQSIVRIREAREEREDRRAGELAAAQRKEQVAEERAHIVEPKAAKPIRIEPQIAQVPKSERVAKEKQKALFTDLPDSVLPVIDLLDAPPLTQEFISADTLEFTSRLIEKKLRDFGIEATVVAAYPGPVITRYEIEPAVGVKGSQIVNLAKDLARSLSLVSIRVVETIPGKTTMGLELPNPKRQMVKLSEIIGSQVYHDAHSMLTMALGKDIAGKAVVADLAKMPHLLVAGTTGSGKSVGINAMILSLLYKATPDQVRLILIDPKMLEMSVYEGIPHLLAPVVTDMRQAGHALNWCVAEMERRYKLMSKLGVRNLAGYNNKIDEATKREEKIPNPFSLTPDAPEPLEKLPTIVIVIDELADLMMVVGKKVEELIARIAQKARAAGIHLILATQRPSVDVITGLIKANVPTRISFQVSSKIDSRTILDQQGAEALLGQGDMLWLAAGTGLPVRVHGAFVSDDEVHRVVEYLKKRGEPDYVEGILEGGVESDFAVDLGPGTGSAGEGGEGDALYDQAVAIVLKNRRASISLVQRHLRIGYNRAARLLEQMEQAGLVS
ncbi:MAG TPA: DNA translocase FtsK 4TM domain-containing protein, partial [Burkholderiaceae bacterium]|nr:DNA translocase FtsK 4TM domain-containing protein [Burkholderiaceae bacterium]